MLPISEAIATAFRAYQAGNWFEAEWICQEIVQQQSGYIPALLLLGAIAQQTSRLESAITYYKHILQLQPNHFEAHSNLAVALQDGGDWQGAESHFKRALELNPTHSPTLFNLGNLRSQQSDLPGAIAYYQQAIALNPSYARAHNNLGNTFRAQGDLRQAEVHFRRAIELEPTHHSTYNNLGNVLQEQGEFAAAVSLYQQALAHQPDNAELYFNQGNALTGLGQYDTAVRSYRQAIALDPNRAEFHNNLALALQEQNLLEPAIAHFRQAIDLNPDYVEAHSNLGAAFYENHDLEAAIDQCRRAIDLQPDHAQAHLNLSFALLAAGDLVQGFWEYEWRWQAGGFQPPNLPGARWDGSDLQGRTILLSAEQGLGDAIHFIRYVPLLAERGARVLVECPPELVRLFGNMSEIAHIIPKGTTLPAFDVYLPLLSLPLVLGTTLATVPDRVPYLSGGAAEKGEKEEPRIGIVWASSPNKTRGQLRSYRNRTVPLTVLMQLQQVSGIRLYSLQVGAHQKDIAQYGYGADLEDLASTIHDFADTAALIDRLDLVISVDTAVAHLAGAMGKPVWVLLPFAADWRWLLQRHDSPWYPTMRLFRQDAPGDWRGVVEKVTQALLREFGGRK